jgi:CubicO group peptidase (beta-lactamase class C family)
MRTDPFVRPIARHLASALTLFASAGTAQAQHDLSAVTSLCESALVGQQIGSPIPGFELLLMKDGKVIYQRAFGTGRLDQLNNADSSTKTLSGAVIASLIDSSAGAPTPFTLDTRLSAILPEYTGDKATITVRQAFAHTSGLPSNSLAQSSTAITLRQAANSIANIALAYPVGSTFNYGGTSMHAAGAAAEAYAGIPWNTLFQQRIAGPLGMTQTRYALTSPTNPRIAAGAESTAREFAALMEMIRRGGLHRQPDGTDVRVLSASSAQAMITRQTPVGIPIGYSPLPGVSDYGVGVWLWTRNPTTLALERALASGARGFSSWIDLDDGVTGVISTETTSAGNVIPWLALVANATQAAVRGPVCEPDVAGAGLGVGGDGELTADDLIVFVNWFAAGDKRADIAGPGLAATSDQELTADDIIVFVSSFTRGC